MKISLVPSRGRLVADSTVPLLPLAMATAFSACMYDPPRSIAGNDPDVTDELASEEPQSRVAPAPAGTALPPATPDVVELACVATPAFTINGTTPPADGSPIHSCASHVIMDAGATTCETSYWVGVQESDRWWNRTYVYEWGRWFSGAAPNGLNLQGLSTTYSYPPYFISGSLLRQGSPLIGGDLSPNVPRYFRVAVCTGEPSWTCLTALLQVDGGC